MKFAELSKYRREDRRIAEKELRLALPDTPLAVIQDVYLDHGSKPEFQDQYNRLSLDQIRWSQQTESGYDLTQCSFYDGFRAHIECFDAYQPAQDEDPWLWLTNDSGLSQFWRSNCTWKTPPYLIDGAKLGNASEFHLVEGHTRMRVLRDAIRLGMIPRERRHLIWLGRF